MLMLGFKGLNIHIQNGYENTETYQVEVVYLNLTVCEKKKRTFDAVHIYTNLNWPDGISAVNRLFLESLRFSLN